MRWLCRALIAAIWMGLSHPAVAQPVTLNPDEMRAAVRYALDVHDDKTALALSQALLRRDPDDGFALIARARAARNLGQFDLAIGAARRAWRIARTDPDRFAAAMVMAQAQASAGRRTWAQLWLRRAAHYAPTPQMAAIAQRDFGYVRSRNPWSTQITLGISPSSNINNGSKSDTIVIGGLPFALSGGAKALSGTELRYGVDTTYRFRTSGVTQWRAGVAVEGRAYAMSQAARAQAPTLSGADLAFQSVSLMTGGNIPIGQRGDFLDGELRAGKTWYGGSTLSDFAQASIARVFALTPRNQLRLSVQADRQWRHDGPLNGSDTLATGLDWSHRRENGDQWQVSVALRDTSSASAAIAHQAGLATLTYAWGRPIGSVALSVTMGLEQRDYDRPLYTSAPRRDHRLSIGLNAVLPGLNYYGFAPELGLRVEQNNSNVSIYETEAVGLTLGFRSVF